MKIENSKPFEEYDCCLNFHKEMKRWQVCLVSKTKKRRTILYSKFLMSIKEGILTADEEVDHINGDRSDDRLENLEIVGRGIGPIFAKDMMLLIIMKSVTNLLKMENSSFKPLILGM